MGQIVGDLVGLNAANINPGTISIANVYVVLS